MNSQGQKRAWKRPQLTVLVRIDLAESVLQTCKQTAQSTGPSSNNSRCQTFAWGSGCSLCSVQRES